MIDPECLNNITEVLNGSRKIVINTHTNPDGDAVGSSLALYFMLKKLGHQVDVVIANSIPSFYSWMPDADKIIYFDTNTEQARKLIDEAEVIFCLDYNAIHRSGSLKDSLKKSNAVFILIDHHQEPELDSFNYHIWNTLRSSTSELVFKLFDSMEVVKLIDKDIASCLFTGIMTDTGSFSYSVSNSETFSIVATLIDLGLDAADVHSKVYNSMTESRLRLMGFAINDRLQIFEKLQTAIIALSKQDLLDYNYQIGDTEGIVNLPLAIENIRLSVLITEKKDHIHLSLRSKGSFSVNEFARKYLNGGGHINAAGGKTYTTIQQTIDDIIRILPEFDTQIVY
jgi:phosphoesterase RecJ-like protein